MSSEPVAREPPMVRIEWLDASSMNEQMSLKEGREKMTLDARVSVGFLILRAKDRFVIAGTFDPADRGEHLDQADNWLTIPRAWTQKVLMIGVVDSVESPPDES